MLLYKQLYVLLLIFLLPHSSFALPSIHPTNIALFSPTNNTSLSLPLLPPNLTTNSGALTGFKWKVLITEALWEIEEEYPGAVLTSILSATEEFIEDGEHFPSTETSDPASLRYFRLLCRLVRNTNDLLIVRNGTLQPENGKVNWGSIETEPAVLNVRKPPTYWPPEHDLFEAAGVLDPQDKYRKVYYEMTQLTALRWEGQFKFYNMLNDRWTTIDAVDERTLERRWWDD